MKIKLIITILFLLNSPSVFCETDESSKEFDEGNERGFTYIKPEDDISPPQENDAFFRRPAIIHEKDLEICNITKVERNVKREFENKLPIKGTCLIIQDCMQKKLSSDEIKVFKQLKKEYCENVKLNKAELKESDKKPSVIRDDIRSSKSKIDKVDKKSTSSRDESK